MPDAGHSIDIANSPLFSCNPCFAFVKIVFLNSRFRFKMSCATRQFASIGHKVAQFSGRR